MASYIEMRTIKYITNPLKILTGEISKYLNLHFHFRQTFFREGSSSGKES